MQLKTKRYHNLQCPLCLSTITVINNEYCCTGDRLKIWENEFKEFETLSKPIEKDEYLDKFSNKDLFIELYNKKDDLNCGFTFSSVIFSNKYEELIPDPIIVGKIEKSLGRRLNDNELEENYTFYRISNKYSTEEFEDSYEYKIPRIKYPDDLM